MRISRGFVTAAIIVGSIGALGGAAIGNSPMIVIRESAPIGGASNGLALGHAPVEVESFPDQYALETRDGRFEIGELALRGRLRNTHMAMTWESAGDPDDDFASELATDERAARIAREAALIAYTARSPAVTPSAAPEPQAPPPAGPPALSRAEAPLALADPVTLTPAPSSRMIDVDAVLVSRD